jgi:hypothetical protein
MAYIPRSARAVFTPDTSKVDSGRADPLYWDAVRCLAARGRIGPEGLARRFKIGRQRARNLLSAMNAAYVTCGWPHRMVYRAMPLAWAWLPVVGTHACAPETPYEYGLYKDGHPAFDQVPGWRAAA